MGHLNYWKMSRGLFLTLKDGVSRKLGEIASFASNVFSAQIFQ